MDQIIQSFVLGLSSMVLLIILYMVGVPIAYSMAMTTLLLLVFSGVNINPRFIATRILGGMDSMILVAIPVYIFAGRLLNSRGFTNRIFDFASELVGPIRGGLGQVNVVASMIFAGMNGSAAADAAGLGIVEYRAMRNQGYSESMSVGVTAASSIIGPIIPPSIIAILYAAVAQVSAGTMLIAGLFPGILIGVGLMIFVLYMTRYEKTIVKKNWNAKKLVESLKHAFFPLFAPVIIVGGILTGFFTPTEAASTAVAYVLLVSILIIREKPETSILHELIGTIKDTGAIMLILAMARLYSWYILEINLPNHLAMFVDRLSIHPTMLLFIIIGFLLIIGCFMEQVAALLILTPVMVPVISGLGIDLYHFGIILIITLMIGGLTPPFGGILFIVSRVTGVPLERTVLAVLPYIIPLIIVVILLAIWPQLVLFIPLYFGMM